MPILATGEKSRRLELGERKEIIDYMKNHGKISYAKVAEIFSKKFCMRIEKSTIYRLHKNRDKYELLKYQSTGRKYLVSDKMREFEEELDHCISETVKFTPKPHCTFEQMRRLGLALQQKDTYRDAADVQKLGLSMSWWKSFRSNRRKMAEDRTHPEPDSIGIDIQPHFIPSTVEEVNPISSTNCLPAIPGLPTSLSSLTGIDQCRPR